MAGEIEFQRATLEMMQQGEDYITTKKNYITNELQGRIPDFIKIDIEGYEMIALSTVKELFKHGKKPIYIFSAGNMRDHGIKSSDGLRDL
jgi:hypothetical protein